MSGAHTPKTDAGRALLDDGFNGWPLRKGQKDHLWRQKLRESVLAIEAEATAPQEGAVAALRRAVLMAQDLFDRALPGRFIGQRREIDRVLADTAQAAADHDRRLVERYVLAGHKCRPVAVMPMKEGRDWWLGELTEPLADWPLETHCLHLKTPLKEVVLGIMRADTDLLAVICRIVSGYIPTEQWMDSIEKAMRAKAAERLATPLPVESTTESEVG